MSKKIGKTLPPVEKILPIRFLILDVDGVMSDGKITYTSDGVEVKSFDVKDGSGLMYWSRVGYTAGIISGRSSPMITKRAQELGIPHVIMGAKHKLAGYEQMIADAGVTHEQTAIVGDDLLELPIFRRAGLSVAVKDAVDEVKDMADLITNRKGGRGAVREVVELILKTQGKWDEIMARYLI